MLTGIFLLRFCFLLEQYFVFGMYIWLDFQVQITVYYD